MKTNQKLRLSSLVLAMVAAASITMDSAKAGSVLELAMLPPTGTVKLTEYLFDGSTRVREGTTILNITAGPGFSRGLGLNHVIALSEGTILYPNVSLKPNHSARFTYGDPTNPEESYEAAWSISQNPLVVTVNTIPPTDLEHGSSTGIASISATYTWSENSVVELYAVKDIDTNKVLYTIEITYSLASMH